MVLLKEIILRHDGNNIKRGIRWCKSRNLKKKIKKKVSIRL